MRFVSVHLILAGLLPAGGSVATDQFLFDTCHNVNEPLPGSDPYMYGIAAGERVAGEDAATYLYNAIINPSAFIAPAQTATDGTILEWAEEVMPNTWTTALDVSRLPIL